PSLLTTTAFCLQQREVVWNLLLQDGSEGRPSSTTHLRKRAVCRRLFCSWHTQKVNFNAICNSRGFGLKAVAVTTPKVRDWTSTPGVSNTGVFVRLNDSARNCNFALSVTWKSLKSEKSRFLTPSLITFGIVREALPYVKGAGTE